jgi:hypothetical protein
MPVIAIEAIAPRIAAWATSFTGPAAVRRSQSGPAGILGARCKAARALPRPGADRCRRPRPGAGSTPAQGLRPPPLSDPSASRWFFLLATRCPGDLPDRSTHRTAIPTDGCKATERRGGSRTVSDVCECCMRPGSAQSGLRADASPTRRAPRTSASPRLPQWARSARR